jgi:hypothetical protein
MPQVARPVAILAVDNKKLRKTKQELAFRKQGEEGMLTGEAMKESAEVRANEDAHKEFIRLKKLFRAIDKDDAIYSQTINRYCLLHAECLAMERRQAKLEEAGDRAEDPKDALAFYKLASNCDRDLMSRRKMMMDIEKENVMTIASALRSIPKKPDKAKNPLMEALSG